jgi:NAD(P)-dependent dehydrogenase (short-subunit alcohol dehydrogenase family)
MGTLRLAGKAGIVVGGGQTPGANLGNGRASALLFAREGARVLVVDRDLESAEETVALIQAEGGEAHALQGDWTREQDCQGFAQSALGRFGRIDFLHNNAGTFGRDDDPERLTLEAYQAILDVNLKGCLLACRAVLPAMRAQQQGSIVNISSAAAVASSQFVAYKVSKAGMNALSQVLALDYAPYGIRVNVVAPGLLDTPMAIEGRSADPQVQQKLRSERDARSPLRGKMGTAWDTASASLFLHSDEASYITAAVLPVDGGYVARIGA